MRCVCMEALESYMEPDMVQANERDSSVLTKRLLRTMGFLIQCQDEVRGLYKTR